MLHLLGGGFFAVLPAHGQPFSTIINIPPDVAPGFIGSNTQLNLFDGGVISSVLDAGASDGTSTNIEVNISGGSVGGGLNDFFNAYEGSEVNISGGSVLGPFEAFSGSVVNISGDSIITRAGFYPWRALSGSVVNVSGGSHDHFSAAGGEVNISGGTLRTINSGRWHGQHLWWISQLGQGVERRGESVRHSVCARWYRYY